MSQLALPADVTGSAVPEGMVGSQTVETQPSFLYHLLSLLRTPETWSILLQGGC